MLFPVTLKDWTLGVKFSRWISIFTLVPFDLVQSNSESNAHGEEISPAPHTPALSNFGVPLYGCTRWHRSTKFTHMGSFRGISYTVAFAEMRHMIYQ